MYICKSIVKLLFVLLFMLMSQFVQVSADEVYYQPGAKPFDVHTHFAGESTYPNTEPITELNGVKFALYNDGTGLLDLDLGTVKVYRTFTSEPVISPDFKNLFYTEVYNYAQKNQVYSKCFYVPVIPPYPHEDGSPITTAETMASFDLRSKNLARYEILSIGTADHARYKFNSLTIVDWSYDSNRILIKEKVGAAFNRIYATEVWFYELNTKRLERLDIVRKAIVNYWLQNQDLDLNTKIWDIQILGWEKDSNNRFVVNAYLFLSKTQKKFLGCWSIDIDQQLAQLLSLDNEQWPVGEYGLMIVKDKEPHHANKSKSSRNSNGTKNK